MNNMNNIIDTRDSCIQKLIELGKTDTRIVVLDADVSKSTRTRLFGNEFPDRFYNVGVTEMNMVSMAAGLATAGMIPFISSFAVFVVLRACEPLRTMISYPGTNVKVLGGYAGLTAHQHGPTHHCLRDLSIMRAMPNFAVLSPSDFISTGDLVEAAKNHKGPVYIRLGYNKQEAIYKNNLKVKIGKIYEIKPGSDVLILSTGLVTLRALKAAEQLKVMNISAKVIDCPTIKPLPEQDILNEVREIPRVITIEEHSIIGGFGSAIAELLAQNLSCFKLKIIGINDIFTESAPYEELLDNYGLSINDIVSEALKILNN